MKDWATSLLEAEAELKALDKLLTNYPVAQKYGEWSAMEMCYRAIKVKSRMDAVIQYVMENTEAS